MTFAFIPTADGSLTARHPRYGETFHSVSGAFEEARERYVHPCRIVETARARGRVRVLDIGFGLGYNLASALAALRDEAPGARLEALSLEHDPEVLAAAAEMSFPPGLAETAPILRELARDGVARGADHDLRLVLGDARVTLEREPDLERYDAVFLDPFSPPVNPELWRKDFLAAIARRMHPDALLSTYSAATAVRLALRAAGLRVGRGPRVGPKREGTLASREAELPPLDERTRRRLERRREEKR